MMSHVDAPAEQQPQERKLSMHHKAVAALCACLFVGGVATAVFRRMSLKQQVDPDSDDDTEPKTPADILLHQIRHLDAREEIEEKEITMRTSLGNMYREEGRFAQAETQYSVAHEIAVKLGGSEHLVNVLLPRGQARNQHGRLSAARKDLEMAYTLVDKEHSPEQAIEVLHRLGDVKRDQGKLNDAMEVYEKAAQMAKRYLSGTALESQLASLVTETGETYVRNGQSEDALKTLRLALKHLEAVHRDPMSVPADSDPQLAVTNTVLGDALQTSGDSSQAMELYRKALRQQVKTLRPSNSDLVFTRMSIARVHRELGDSEKALEALNAVEQTIRAGPAEGPDLARVLILKADLLREAKKYSEATEAIAEALKHQGSCFAGEHTPEIAVALNTYGSLLQDQKKFQDALRNYKRALELNMETVGYNHPETAATHNSIGSLYEDIGDDLSAQQHFEKCLDIQLHTSGAVSPDMATTYNNLGTILYRRGELEDAASLLGKALEVLDKVGASEKDPDRLMYKENLDGVVRLIHKKNQKYGTAHTGLHV